MIKKIVLTLVTIFLIHIAQGQDLTHNISAPEAKALLKSLDQKNVDTVRVDHLLRLALYNILKAGEYKADLDSAAAFINKAEIIAAAVKSPAIHGYIAWVKSNLYREKGEKDHGKKFAESAVALLGKTSDKYHLGSAYLELAQYDDFSDPKQLMEKTSLIELSAKALSQSNDIELKAYAYKALADLYSTQSAYAKALQNIKLSLEAYQSIHYKQLQGVYIIYSSVYSLSADYKNALKYGLEALRTAERVKDTTMQLCEINNIVAVILGKLDEKEKAISYYKNALHIAEKYNDHASVVLITSNVAITYRAIHKYNEALNFLKTVDPKYLETESPAYVALIPAIYCNLYTALKLYPQAKSYTDKLLKILAKQSGAIANLDNVYDVLVLYFTATKQYNLARLYLLKSDDRIKKADRISPIQLSRNYGRWFELDSAIGNYRAALYDHLRYTNIRDSLFTETKSKQLKQIEVQYETEKKVNEIKILNQKNELLNKGGELQQSKLQKANLIKNFTLAAVLLLFVIVLLVYRQYRLKKKSNDSITQKNDMLQHLLTEKEWLLKEVHHRVKNNLHTVICLLESQAAYLENDALQAIEKSQHRIYAMSLIHQKLYQSDDIKTIDMATYIPELVENLEASFDTSDQIKFKLKIDPIHLTLSHAIPLGLIINEAVTNSIKYAFPDKNKGEISIAMIDDGKQIALEIADNGIGMPESTYETELESLGMELMKGLSKDIDAVIGFKVENGTKITIQFKPDALNDTEGFLRSSEIKEGLYV